MSVLVTYKGVALKHGNAYMHRQVGSPEPEPIVLPPQTIRFRFENSDYDPTVIENGGVWTKVAGSSYNDWDWYCADTDWEIKFDMEFTEEHKVSIIATGDMRNLSSVEWMFGSCTGLTSIPANAFPNLTNANSMFNCCTGLISIPENAFPNLTDAYNMFYGCTGLTSIPDNAFPNLTNAELMFYGCTGLTSIPENAFPILTDATEMFEYCYALTSIPDNAFPNVTMANSMFYYCEGLTSIPENAFPNVISADDMFAGCTKVQHGALALYNKMSSGGKVISHGGTFSYCGQDTETGYEELQQIPEEWGGLKEDEPVIELPANTIRFRFENADYDPTVIDNGGVWTKVEDSSYNDWDWYCEDTDWESKFNNDNGWAFTEDNRTSIIATGDMSNVTSGTFCMFYGCTGLTSIPENAFPNLTNADNYMFYGCTGLTSIPENAFPNLTNAGNYMFGGCTGLTSIPENLFPNLTGGTGMFDGCTGLTSIPENLFPNLTNGGAMFRDCTGLTSIPENLFPKLTNGYNMFCGCTNVQNGALGLYRNLLAGGTVTSHSGTFYQCGSNTETGRAELNQIPKSWGGLAS